LLNYFLDEQSAKRRFYATASACNMPAARRAFDTAYTRLYYHLFTRALASRRF